MIRGGQSRIPIPMRPPSTGAAPAPPPPSSTDRFAPSIIVGNVANGDPAVAQAAPFRYIPDTGNGAGLALAVSEAAAAAPDQRSIYVRPGTYPVPATLVIPGGVSLVGGGRDVTILTSDGDVRRLVSLSALGGVAATLEGVTLRVEDPLSITPTGTEVLEVLSDGIVRSVRVECPTSSAPGLDSITAMVRLPESTNDVVLDDVVVDYDDASVGSPSDVKYGFAHVAGVGCQLLACRAERAALRALFTGASAANSRYEVQGSSAYGLGRIEGSYSVCKLVGDTSTAGIAAAILTVLGSANQIDMSWAQNGGAALRALDVSIGTYNTIVMTVMSAIFAGSFTSPTSLAGSYNTLRGSSDGAEGITVDETGNFLDGFTAPLAAFSAAATAVNARVLGCIGASFTSLSASSAFDHNVVP